LPVAGRPSREHAELLLHELERAAAAAEHDAEAGDDDAEPAALGLARGGLPVAAQRREEVAAGGLVLSELGLAAIAVPAHRGRVDEHARPPRGVEPRD